MKLRAMKLVLAAGTLLLLSACSMMAPKYTFAPDQVQVLRGATLAPAKLGAVTAQGNEAHNDSITLRGSGMHSPYGSYAQYLQEALTQDLREARLLDAQSSIEISAVLLKNDIDAKGFVTASADIEARFTVKHASQVAYEKNKSAHIEWDSNFIGAIAIPRAQEHYPALVAALLKELYADAEFLQALHP